jgi:hypothetical protein
MAISGWIKLHRGINEWGWKKDPHVLALWVHLLTNVNTESAYFLGELIPKGSLATGRESLSVQTGLSISQVRTCLEKLKKTGEIATLNKSNFSIISIVKWDDYQDNRQQVSQQSSQHLSQQSSHQIATIKESKKKEERIYIKGVKKPEDVSEQVWKDFLELRKEKKAPVTETVISRSRQEAAKIKWTLEQALIECCLRGWQGFKAEYLTQKTGNNQNGKLSQNSIARTSKNKSVSQSEFESMFNPNLS